MFLEPAFWVYPSPGYATGTGAPGTREWYTRARVYPNPSSGNFRIEHLTGNGGKPTLLKMMNLQGQLVFTRLLNSGDHELNVQLPPGVYLFSVASENGTQTELITIQ